MHANQELQPTAMSEPVQDTNISVKKALQDNLTLFVQLIGLGVALWGPLIVIMIWMSGNFTDIRSDISNLDSKLTGQIQELDTRLSSQIQALDNKINAIGDMTVIAFTDGEISSDELVAIWERAGAP